MNQTTFHVYLVSNSLNGKVYVGKTTIAPEARWWQHIKESRSRRCRYPLHLAIRKYGADAFTIQVLETAATEEDLNARERYWIAFLRSHDVKLGYNRTFGADGRIHSEETRRRIAAAATGRRHTDAAKGRMSEAHKGKTPHWLVGKTLTDEHKKKLSASKRGKKYRKRKNPPSPESRARHSARMSGINNPFFGKRHDEKTRAALRGPRPGFVPANKGVPHSLETREKMKAAWTLRRAKNNSA